ncbi:MAG TPA: dockerin type I repeat-containing protein [Patescibacteria group bacterium]|nr:dockerin type I repeat-containing protein [Patescibacteria group bacterium]
MRKESLTSKNAKPQQFNNYSHTTLMLLDTAINICHSKATMRKLFTALGIFVFFILTLIYIPAITNNAYACSGTCYSYAHGSCSAMGLTDGTGNNCTTESGSGGKQDLCCVPIPTAVPSDCRTRGCSSGTTCQAPYGTYECVANTSTCTGTCISYAHGSCSAVGDVSASGSCAAVADNGNTDLCCKASAPTPTPTNCSNGNPHGSCPSGTSCQAPYGTYECVQNTITPTPAVTICGNSLQKCVQSQYCTVTSGSSCGSGTVCCPQADIRAGPNPTPAYISLNESCQAGSGSQNHGACTILNGASCQYGYALPSSVTNYTEADCPDAPGTNNSVEQCCARPTISGGTCLNITLLSTKLSGNPQTSSGVSTISCLSQGTYVEISATGDSGCSGDKFTATLNGQSASGTVNPNASSGPAFVPIIDNSYNNSTTTSVNVNVTIYNSDGSIMGTQVSQVPNSCSGSTTQPTNSTTTDTPTPSLTPSPTITVAPGSPVISPSSFCPTNQQTLSLTIPNSSGSHSVSVSVCGDSNCSSSNLTSISSGTLTLPGPVNINNSIYSGVQTGITTANLLQVTVDGQSSTIPYTDTCSPATSPTGISPTGVGPTATPIAGSTTVSFTAHLHGIGDSGDNVNPSASGSNQSPVDTALTATVYAYPSEYTASNPTANPVITGTGTLTYNANHNFTLSSPINLNLPSDTYLFKLSVPKYLTKALPNVKQVNTINSGNTFNFGDVTLVTGDVNGDNQLDINDYTIILGCINGSSSCDASTQKLADLNDDGVVDITDLNLFERELMVQTGQ